MGEQAETAAGLEEQAPEEVAEREEHEDHQRDGHRRERDEGEVRGSVPVQKVAPLVPGGRRRSEMR
jgi:hypothetical protein